jgi:hypothetical protein
MDSFTAAGFHGVTGFMCGRLQRGFRFLGDARKLGPIVADVDYIMRNNKMILRIDSDLYVVADNAGAAATRRHRSGIGIGQRDLLVRRVNERTRSRGRALRAGRYSG